MNVASKIENEPSVDVKYVAYRSLDKKNPSVQVFDVEPSLLLDNEWSVVKVESLRDMIQVPGKIQSLIYRLATGEKLEKFENLKIGAERTLPLLEKLVISLSTNDHETLKQRKEQSEMTKASTKPKAKKEKQPSKREALLNKKIVVKADKNPKREGSESHKRFEFYRTGQLVKTYLEKGGTMGDLNFDRKQGFIVLE